MEFGLSAANMAESSAVVLEAVIDYGNTEGGLSNGMQVFFFEKKMIIIICVI
jgi:hypothetical protein